MKKKLKSVLFVLILFLAIFNPPIIPGVSFTILACLGSAVYVKQNIGYAKMVLNKPSIRPYVRGMKYLYIYYLIIAVANTAIIGGVSFILIDYVRSLGLFVLSILVPLAITIYEIKNEYTVEKILSTLVLAGFVESILAVIAFFSPSIKNIFVNMMASVAGDNADQFLMVSDWRNFGLASNLADSFGYAMSVLAVIALFLAIQNKKFYLLFIIILFAGAINARTSIVLSFVGGILLILRDVRKMGYALLFIVLAIIIIPIVFKEETENVKWMLEGLNELSTYAETGERTGIVETATTDFIFFPDNFFNIVFGCGDNPYRMINRQSDMGYIQMIWTLGIVGSLILYTVHLKFFLLVKRKAGRFGFLIFINIVMFLLYQLKLHSIGYAPPTLILNVFLFGVCCQEHVNKKCRIV